MTVQVPLPPGEAEARPAGYALHAVATDVNGNTSDDTDASPPRDGGPADADYRLDRIEPEAISASHGQQNEQVVVQLTESVAPAGDQGVWRIDGVDVTASGEVGPTRLLTAAGPVPDGAIVTWQPEGGTYLDGAGNELERFEDPGLAVVPALPLEPPVVLVPAAPVLTRAATATVSGTAPPRANVVDVSRGTEQPQTIAVTDGTWSYEAPLAEGANAFEVRARAEDGGISTRVSVPRITRDSVAPEVTAIAPTAVPGAIPPLQDPRVHYGDGDTVEVEWDVQDAADSPVHVVVTATYGGAAPVEVATRDGEGPGSAIVQLPDVDAETEAFFTITATDAAGNVGTADTDPILIVPDLVGAAGELTANDPLNAVIALTYAADLAGQPLPTAYRANNGTTGTSQDRVPLGANRAGRVVTLTFAQAFPDGEGDRNARPTVQLVSALGAPTAADGREVTTGPTPIADIEDPVATQVTGVPSGPTNVQDDRLVLTGTTDVTFDPNNVTVTLTRNGVATVVGQIRSATDGTFSVPVDLAPNTANLLRVDVVDPSGNAAAPVEVTVLEDSLAPTATRLIATLEGSDRVALRWGFDEIVQRALFEYRTGTGDWQLLQDTAPNAAEGQLSWTLPDGVNPAAGLTFRVTGTDIAGNVSNPPTVVGLTNLPRIVAAVADGLTTVHVTTSEPVTTTEAAPSGFGVQGGPGVRATDPEGTQITLELNGALPGGSSTLTYTGDGGWAATDGRPLSEGSVPIRIPDGFLFPVTGLVAGPTQTGGANLSWVDERNAVADVDRYEVTRDSAVVGSAGPTSRLFIDPTVAAGSHTWTVTVVGTDGSRSDPVSVTITLGAGPEGVPGGGTGAPDGSMVLEDCPFTGAPNITADGGGILSCDGRVAVLVPPGAADRALYGKVVRRSAVPVADFGIVTDLYQLVVMGATDSAALDAFEGYVEVSFRHGPALWDTVTRERIATHRSRADGVNDELAPRVTRDTVGVHVITVGSLAVTGADGATVRAYGPDPAVPADRFATAAALSQTQLASAGAAVIARADDYPDALAAAPLAATLGGPVLLSRTGDVPQTTLLELARLGVEDIVLVGGEAALSPAVAAQLMELGFTVGRVAGENRFETAAAVAEEVGSLDGEAYLATGGGFADALSASAPAAALTRPILLAQHEDATAATLEALAQLGVTDVTVVGGDAAISEPVAAALTAAGYDVSRAAGPTRVETAIALASALVAAGDLHEQRPALASADGDGVTSPDALAAGPIAARLGSPLLLVPRDTLPETLATHLATASDLRGILLAGGPMAVTDPTRAAVDAAAG